MTQELRTLCLTCHGGGDIPVERAYRDPDTGKIVGRPSLEPCWFCHGEGFMKFAKRRQR